MQFASFVLLALASVAHAVTRRITLDIVNGPVAPDGFTRVGVLANGTFPGPVITANKGDTLVVKVNNQLTDPSMRRSTSIDFDGVFTETDNIFNEGSPFVTQCPFGPQTSYTYNVPLESQTGTFWYHSQLSLQYADGLRGALIVYDPQDPLRSLYDVDDESTILTVADWWHTTSTSGLASYIATQIIPVADAGLFNGKGRTVGGPAVEYAAVAVTKGKRYRFRLINMSARSDFHVSIDNHTMTIIAADGVATVPHTVNILDILAGQRYDFVVTANQAVGNYWINTILSGGNPARNPNLNPTLGRGILRYAGAPHAEPAAPMTDGPTGAAANLLEEGDLRPLVPEAPPEPDFELSFTTSMTVNKTEWNINNISYISPTVPTLVRVLDGDTVSFNKSENTFLFPRNKVIQITFPASDEDELHPFHLHGNNFWVIKTNNSDTINTVNPIKRDVEGMGSGGSIVRFRMDKAGPWFFHCHIFWHFQAGLASVMGIGFDELPKEVHPTAAWDALCPAYNKLPAAEQ